METIIKNHATSDLVPPQGWLQGAWDYLGLTPWQIPFVIFASVAIYLFFILLVRLFGSRILSGFSTFDTVAAIMFGAVAGRVILSNTPTLVTGAIGLVTLMVMEQIFGSFHRYRETRRGARRLARVIVAHGEIQVKAMHKAHITETQLLSAIRKKGITDFSQIKAAILEATGGFSVIEEGVDIDPRILSGVVGSELILDASPQSSN